MKILLGVCGSIAAYRTPDIVRGLVKSGHEVRVILTKGAENFVSSKVFNYIGAQKTYTSQDDFHAKNVLHVDLARWCDTFAIAPLSANTLARLVQGEASDLLSSVFLALEQEKVLQLYPAMNTHMYRHPFVQRNLNAIKELPQTFICPPEAGELVCGEQGEGKLPQVDRILDMIPLVNPQRLERRKKILISTGATIAPLDSVRFLTNPSSGLTGYHLAIQALKLKQDVHVIAGPYASSKLDQLKDIPGFTLERTITSKDMGSAVDKEIKSSDIYISSAAICDIEFNGQKEKIKKDALKQSLPINIDRDILKDVLTNKRSDQKIIGFAAETDLNEKVLMDKWKNKPVDLLIGTHVHNGLIDNDSAKGFGTSHALYSFVNKGKIEEQKKLSKEELANEVFSRVLHD